MISRLSNQPVELSRDGYLSQFRDVMSRRETFIHDREKQILENFTDLYSAADWHLRFGLHRKPHNWLFREWLPNATGAWLCGDFNGWKIKDEAFALRLCTKGCWERSFQKETFHHLDRYQLYVEWPGGGGWRLPSAATWVVRETGPDGQLVFNARVWQPENDFSWQNTSPSGDSSPLIYESHVGMAQEEPRVGTFAEFSENILPRIAADGYTCVQLMAVAQHPYYASFGYHVSNFFSVCDLFGTPDDFKRLVDRAHGLGLRVIMDLVHSHSVKNEQEGLSAIAGDFHQYFRCTHDAWGSCCFDYGKPEVARMLLSNCRFWLEEYHLDGFRFDGVTSMMYFDHGLSHAFTSYGDYFNSNADWDAIAYLAMANQICHAVNPDCWTIAEDVSGMPGLAAPINQGGIGFDFRLAMGVTDTWFKLLDIPDESWNMCYLWHEVTNRRQDERTISYVESHDQAMVGGKTFLFTCLDAEMYTGMNKNFHSFSMDRGVALHKMSRLLTAAAAGHGYMNFMGNEFGHPEWIDFPRAGNGNSFQYARRQWHLADDDNLKYHGLQAFDQAMTSVIAGKNVRKPFYDCRCQLLQLSDFEHIVAFERAGLIFVFNFNPDYSYSDYRLLVPDSGVYRMVLNSDEPEFCGFGRMKKDISYPAITLVENHVANTYLRLYLPARTAAVFEPMN